MTNHAALLESMHVHLSTHTQFHEPIAKTAVVVSCKACCKYTGRNLCVCAGKGTLLCICLTSVVNNNRACLPLYRLVGLCSTPSTHQLEYLIQRRACAPKHLQLPATANQEPLTILRVSQSARKVSNATKTKFQIFMELKHRTLVTRPAMRFQRR